MAQAKITNHTACEYQVLFANDENFRPIVTPIVKATFDISPEGELRFSKEQVPVNLEGEFVGDPESSSYLYEPESAFIKPATDVVIIGDAVSNAGPVTHLLVEVHVGSMQKRVGVIGDRQWVKQAVGYAISEIAPFETMPICYENAFGGWDKRHDDARRHGFEARNTVGKGFYRSDVEHLEGVPMPLPNIENPDALIEDIKDAPEPIGLGFTLPHWQPRATYAGTYDEAWESSRSPMLPDDFDRQFFCAASRGLTAQGYLQGNEPVYIKNMTASGELRFQLPGARPPICKVELANTEKTIQTKLDTVIINLKAMQLQLIWRNYMLLAGGVHDVAAIDIHYG